jgi:hypothetical protein
MFNNSISADINVIKAIDISDKEVLANELDKYCFELLRKILNNSAHHNQTSDNNFLFFKERLYIMFSGVIQFCEMSGHTYYKNRINNCADSALESFKRLKEKCNVEPISSAKSNKDLNSSFVSEHSRGYCIIYKYLVELSNSLPFSEEKRDIYLENNKFSYYYYILCERVDHYECIISGKIKNKEKSCLKDWRLSEIPYKLKDSFNHFKEHINNIIIYGDINNNMNGDTNNNVGNNNNINNNNINNNKAGHDNNIKSNNINKMDLLKNPIILFGGLTAVVTAINAFRGKSDESLIWKGLGIFKNILFK